MKTLKQINICSAILLLSMSGCGAAETPAETGLVKPAAIAQAPVTELPAGQSPTETTPADAVKVVEATVRPSTPPPPALKTDRPRVKVVEGAHGFTVQTASGLPLRGGAAWVFRWGRKTGDIKYIHDPGYYEALRGNGLNALRLIWFDPWQWGHGESPEYPDGYDHANLDSQEDIDATFADIDKVVDLASQHGLYVLLNYHNTGDYRDRKAETLNYLTKFWSIAAERYKHRTHVFYEMVNEPVEWWPDSYSDKHLQNFKAVYDLMRRKAPESHIVVLSFANTIGFATPPKTMRSVARRFDALGDDIDWTKTSVGFHPYGNKGSSASILDLMQEFPAINTEQGLPDNVSQAAEKMDGEYMGVQTMERLGISWFHWYIAGAKDFKENYVGRVVKDAREKGYFWNNDSSIPVAPAGLQAFGRDQSAFLSWSAVDKAASYNVYRGTAANDQNAKLVADGVHTLSFQDKELKAGTNYFYRVTAVNSLGESPRSVAASARPEAQAVAGGTGLTGQYYRAKDVSSELKLTRVDEAINFNWGYGPPVPGLEWKDFSLRWSGMVQAPYSGPYTFYVTADDGVRLWIGDTEKSPVIDEWKSQDQKTHRYTVNLKGGQKYPLKLENFDEDSNHQIRLEWSYPGQPRQLVPGAYLYPTPDSAR